MLPVEIVELEVGRPHVRHGTSLRIQLPGQERLRHQEQSCQAQQGSNNGVQRTRPWVLPPCTLPARMALIHAIRCNVLCYLVHCGSALTTRRIRSGDRGRVVGMGNWWVLSVLLVRP